MGRIYTRGSGKSERDMEDCINAALGDSRLDREVLVLLPNAILPQYDLYVVTDVDRINLARRAAGLSPLPREG